MVKCGENATCEVCGSPNVIEVQCKRTCRNCGFRCDCAEEPSSQ